MIKFELKKLKEGLSYKSMVAILLVVLFTITIMPLRSYSYVSNINELPIKGLAAIKELKASYKESKSELSVDYLNEVLSYYNSFSSSTEAELETNKKYPGVLLLLMKAYGSLDEPSYNLSGVTGANDFYSRNQIELKNHINENSVEGKSLIKKMEKIKNPYNISFSKPWVNMWKSMMILGFYLAIVAILIGSKIFSIEKEVEMDKVMTISRQSKKRYIAKNKISALLFLLSKWYFISIFIILAVKIFTTGISGISSQIQTEYFFSTFSLSFGSATFLYIITEWLGILTVGLITAWINLVLTKTSTTFIVATIINFIPFVVGKIGGSISNTFMKTMHLFPINAIDFISRINRLELYFGFLSPITVVLILGIVFIALTYALIPAIYSHNRRTM